jgi:hypothetical protein
MLFEKQKVIKVLGILKTHGATHESKFSYPGITGVKFTLLHSAEGYSDIDSLN